MIALKDKVLRTLFEHGLVVEKGKVLVGVSGGPDSMALLHILLTSAPGLGIALHVAHLNHMIRGKAGKADEKFVVSFCKKHSIPVTVKTVDVPRLAREMKVSLEDAGRRARYDLFESLSEEIKAERIALGHNADDNVETALMRLISGAGARGLSGIPVRRGKIIRPLLDCSRAEIEAYCREKKLKFRIDLTNLDKKYLRNRIRHELIPYLIKLNPKVREAIRQAIEIVGADFQYLAALSEKALKGALIKNGKGSLTLDIDKLAMYPDSIRRSVLRLAIEDIKGDLENISFDHIKSILSKLPDKKRWELHLPAGVFATGDGDQFEIRDHETALPEGVAFRYELSVPGSVEVKEAGLRISAEIIKNISGLKLKTRDGMTALLDLGKIGGKLLVRSRSQGDWFVPFGISGSKKLKDFFIDEKVPGKKKDIVPIVESRGRIAWVAGMRIDDRFKITASTKKAVRLSLSR